VAVAPAPATVGAAEGATLRTNEGAGESGSSRSRSSRSRSSRSRRSGSNNPHPLPPLYIYIYNFFKIFLVLFHGPAIKFDRYPCDTAEIAVLYVPIPEMGTVYTGVGMVLKFPTCSIPVTNPSTSSIANTMISGSHQT